MFKLMEAAISLVIGPIPFGLKKLFEGIIEIFVWGWLASGKEIEKEEEKKMGRRQTHKKIR